MSNDKIEIFQDKAGEWRWHRQAANGEIIASSGEGYTRQEDAQRAADRAFEPENDSP